VVTSIVPDGSRASDGMRGLDAIAREGARRLLAAALEAEVAEALEAARGERDDNGRALVVRNGRAREREVVTVAGAVPVSAPRLNDRRVDEETGERMRFRSSILPPYARRSPAVTEVLPLLYLHGLSTKDFVPALAEHFGTAAGLSASVISRLTASWEIEVAAFMNRDLSKSYYVYCWVDGVHFNIRLGEDKRLCCLVIVGVRLDGTKELVAISDGYRESTQSWSELLRDVRRRGMEAPSLVTGDGALGFWTAVADVFPETRHQRDWVHKTMNVLNCLPAAVQPGAKKAIFQITNAENKAAAEKAIRAFVDDYGAKWPKAAAKIVDDSEELLAFYDFPAEHWAHLRTSNPIESTFSPVKARTNVTRGAGSRKAALGMAFKLIEAAQGRWRRINAPHLVALVAAGAKFVNGKLVERVEEEVAA
jgi:putative transposase